MSKLAIKIFTDMIELGGSINIKVILVFDSIFGQHC